MQIKHLLTAAALLLTALWADAEVLSPKRALARATAEAAATGAPRRIAAKAASTAPMLTLTDGSEPAVYVFAPAGGGLIAVSAESDAEAMLGYSDLYTDRNTPLPPALRMMLDAYSREIAALRSLPAKPAATAPRADFAPIAPLCKTKWDQGAPYNARCPELNGSRSVTGCVATAMAQVLHSYQHPKKCSGGTFSYAWQNNSNSTLSLNFNDVTLDWGAMKATYTETGKADAVATLMQAVGYAAQMNYSPTASGAQSRLMVEGLVRNFDYDATISYEQRSWYPLAIWQKKVYDALAEGHPIYYDGTTPDYSAGHAFVVDGYSSDGFFHLNWGWGGTADGYFRLSALNPAEQGIGGSASGYEVEQGAVFGMRPGATTPHADVPLNFYAINRMEAEVESAKLAQAVSFKFTYGGVYNNGPLSVTAVHPAVKLTASDGTATYIHSSSKYTDCHVYDGFSGFSVTFPSSLAPGNYIIAPAVYNPSTKKYYDVHCCIGDGSTLPAEVRSGKITFGEPIMAFIEATDMKVSSTLYPATYFNFSATLTNNSTETFYGSAILYLTSTKEDSDYSCIAGAVALELAPGESTDVATVMELPSAIAYGEYNIFLADNNGYLVSEASRVTVAARPEKGTPTAAGLRCTNTDKSALTFKMSVGCQSGLYADRIYLLIADREITRYITWTAGPITVIAEGERQNVTLTFNFSEGLPGTSYYAIPAYFDGEYITPMPKVNPLLFTPTASGIEETEAQPSADAPAEFFDLSGRRVSNPSGGIFIRRQGNSISKVRL